MAHVVQRWVFKDRAFAPNFVKYFHVKSNHRATVSWKFASARRFWSETKTTAIPLVVQMMQKWAKFWPEKRAVFKKSVP
jgi:hypothetical protein